MELQGGLVELVELVMALVELVMVLVVPEVVELLEFAVVLPETWKHYEAWHVEPPLLVFSPEQLLHREQLNYYGSVSAKRSSS